jgi:hypothetical protein
VSPELVIQIFSKNNTISLSQSKSINAAQEENKVVVNENKRG